VARVLVLVVPAGLVLVAPVEQVQAALVQAAEQGVALAALVAVPVVQAEGLADQAELSNWQQESPEPIRGFLFSCCGRGFGRSVLKANALL
jgi:hypothetical protein